MKIHENVIKILDFGNAVYEKENGKNNEVMFIVLELASGGVLFDYVAISGKF